MNVPADGRIRRGVSHKLPAFCRELRWLITEENTLHTRGSASRQTGFRARGLTLCVMLVLIAVCAGAAANAGETQVQQLRTLAAELAESAQNRGVMTVPGTDGWLFFDQELAHIAAGTFWGAEAAGASRARNLEFADPLPAILDFHAQLEAVDVDLLLVPVPPKAIIYPDRLRADSGFGDPPQRLDAAHGEFYDRLRAEGLSVLDLTDVFLSQRESERGPMYCRQDTHWCGPGIVAAADAISALVKDMPWYDPATTESYASEWRTRQISGDLWTALDDAGLDRETVSLRHVEQPGSGRAEPVQPEPESPVILLGDSHNLVFQAGGDMHAQGAGLADQLALELGFPVDLIAVRGSGATPARINLLRRAQRNPDYWGGKKLVVWVFTAREFTHSDGWRVVPISP